jgi:hypothetical protein
MQNSIIWGAGSYTDEVLLDRSPEAAFVIEAENSLLRTRLTDVFAGNNLLNVPPRPLFVDPPFLNFRPDSLSPLINAGALLGITEDITGKKRDEKPDIGAYEK